MRTWIPLFALACAAGPTDPAAPPEECPVAEPSPYADAVLYVVRHAETLPGLSGDPSLSEAGEARAALLAALLVEAPLAGVYSSDAARTGETAAPVAESQGLTVEIYDDPGALAESLRLAGGHFLVVGHSDTVGLVVSGAGGEAGEPLDEDEHDLLTVVTAPGEGPATTVRLRY